MKKVLFDFFGNNHGKGAEKDGDQPTHQHGIGDGEWSQIKNRLRRNRNVDVCHGTS